MAKAPRGTTRRVGLDSSAGVVLDSANLGWHGLPLRAELQQRLGVPVVIDNDVCASALAELAALPGGSVCPWLYFSVGTGIGACVVLDAVEARFFCGDVGHMPVPAESRQCRCGKHGCLETVASGRASTRAAKELIAAGPGHNLNSRVGSITGRDVLDAALEGDETCLEVVASAGHACGLAVGNLLNLLTPAGVGLAGGMIAADSSYLEALAETARPEMKPWLQERSPFYIAHSVKALA